MSADRRNPDDRSFQTFSHTGMVWIWIIVAFVDLTGHCHKSNSDVLIIIITVFENNLKALIIYRRHHQEFFAPDPADGGLESFRDLRCHPRFEIRLTHSIHHS